MGRPINMERLRAAWDYIQAGGSYVGSGVPVLAPILKRKQADGWTWEHLEWKLVRGYPLSGMANDDPPPDMTVEEPPKVVVVRPQMPPRPQPERPAFVKQEDGEVQNGPAGYSRLGGKRSDLYHRNLMAHEDATLARSQRILAWVDAALAGAEPFLKLKTTRSTKQGLCRACGAETPVEEVVIHPLRANIAGLVRAVKEANEGVAMALHIPVRYLPAKVKDARLEVLSQLDRLNEAFKGAFNEAIEQGLIEEDVAVQIWTAAKRAIDGGPTGEL